MTLQNQIDQILKERKVRGEEVKKELFAWKELEAKLSDLCGKCVEAESHSPSLKNLSAQVKAFQRKTADQIKSYGDLRDRFNRNDICIGIGGAARVGKSTFLQAVTGLDDKQIPTSRYDFTTAGRSLIVNDEKAYAIADFHDEQSFLEDVVSPMVRALGRRMPETLNEFADMDFSGEAERQKSTDIQVRIKDTQKALPEIRKLLDGSKNVMIDINDVRDYVAYPDNGDKAGKFMAVKDITIFAPFPQNEVRQLRVVDLPGLGEAGRDLAQVQTRGLADICDITLLMKRPIEASHASWDGNDTDALDAIGSSMKLLKDKTRYTLILLNHSLDDPEDLAGKCERSIRKQLDNRDFKIIRCDACNREMVQTEVMPAILRFLADNLPGNDQMLLARAKEDARQLKQELSECSRLLRGMLEPILAKDNESPTAFAKNILQSLAARLAGFSNELKASAQKPDEEWNRQIAEVTEKVKKWVNDGCGYGSRAQLCQKIADEILLRKGQPSDVINAVRVDFRKQWDVIDLHLEKRICQVLCRFNDILRECTTDFVPKRKAEDLSSNREQLRMTAKKIKEAPQKYAGDQNILDRFAEPLQRLSEFDIRFRFHLEPQLIAATEVLVSNELPIVKNEADAEDFTRAVIEKLEEKINEYSQTMSGGRENDRSRKKLEDLVSGAVRDLRARKQVLDVIGKNLDSSMSFSPNRIFAAIVENTTDAIIRFKDSDRAFGILVRNYANDLRPAPSPEIRYARDVNAEINNLGLFLLDR